MEARFWLKMVGILLSFTTITSALINYDVPMENFICKDRTQVLLSSFCNGIRDCKDGSDEKPVDFSTYPKNLSSPYIRCKHRNDKPRSNQACALRREEFCKRNIQCFRKTMCDVCPSHFQCPNSACWKRSTVCDGDPCNDCPAFQHWNNGHGFKCARNGRNCNLPQMFLWDGIADCDDKSDLCYTSENGDVRDVRSSHTFNHRLCFQCTNDPMIISRSSVCDDVIDCPDMSDECSCNVKTPRQCGDNINDSMPRCNCFDNDGVCYNTMDQTKISCNSKNEICDKLAHCLGNSPCEYLCPSHFQCPNLGCLKRSTVCDGDICNDCPSAFQRPIGEHGFKCARNGRNCNLPQMFLWDGIADCDDKSDLCYTSEIGDVRDVRSSHTFNHRLCFQCTNDPMIISRSNVCDGVINCPDKSDECFCQSGKIECGKSFLRANIFSFPDFWLCEPHQAIEFGGMCYERKSWRWIPFSQICNGKRDCPGRVLHLDQNVTHDEVFQLCKHRKHCDTKDGLYLNIPMSKVCDGFIDCQDESDEYPEVMCTEKGRFYCPTSNGAKISVHESVVCDLTINCDDQSDEINCTNDGRFYCENKEPLFVKKEKKFNGVGDCTDWSDECPTKTKIIIENIFSSRYELIANPFLRAIVWIMGVFAIVGNLVVIVMESKALVTTESQSASFRTNHLLVLNLSVSDLLMGVYLIMLGAASVRYSGNYCANDLIWRSSGSCTTMGVLVLLSSETSVLTMVLLTMFRLYAVKNPFNASLKPDLKTVILSIILSWAFSFTIAFIPLTTKLQHLFETKAWMNENPFFDNVAVDFSNMNNFLDRFVTFQSYDSQVLDTTLMRVNDANSWMDFMDILKDYNYTELFHISGYLGYYSSSSVCISKLYVTTIDKAWGYSIAIITLNFLAFMFVAITYFWIYKKSTASARQVNERPIDGRAATQNKEMQKKILRLIITDFLCWVPISIAAFLNIGGVPLPPVMYAVSAIILLPINSSLNPLIYSNAPKLLYDRVRDGLRAVFGRQPEVEQQENMAVVANRENLHVVEAETTL